MIISAQARRCKNCGSKNLTALNAKPKLSKRLNATVAGVCDDCGYKSTYPQITANTIRTQTGGIFS